jgi:hypothetical protein
MGLVLAAGLGNLLGALLYRVSPFDPAVMANRSFRGSPKRAMMADG